MPCLKSGRSGFAARVAGKEWPLADHAVADHILQVRHGDHQVRSVLAHVADRQNIVGRKLVVDREVPLLDTRRPYERIPQTNRGARIRVLRDSDRKGPGPECCPAWCTPACCRASANSDWNGGFSGSPQVGAGSLQVRGNGVRTAEHEFLAQQPTACKRIRCGVGSPSYKCCRARHYRTLGAGPGGATRFAGSGAATIELSRELVVIRLAVLDFDPGRVILPAQTEVQGQTVADAPVILEVKAIDAWSADPRFRICKPRPMSLWQTQHEVGLADLCATRAGCVLRGKASGRS